MSLSNTGEPLFITNRSGNRPSHEGARPVLGLAVQLCRRAGFTDMLLRNDTDFALTGALDAWHADGVRFVFGIGARKNLVHMAESQNEDMHAELVQRAERERLTPPRRKPTKVKDEVVRHRGYEVLVTKGEDLCDFRYRPGKCATPVPFELQ